MQVVEIEGRCAVWPRRDQSPAKQPAACNPRPPALCWRPTGAMPPRCLPPPRRPPRRTGSWRPPPAAAPPSAAGSPARAARCTPCRSLARQTPPPCGPAAGSEGEGRLAGGSATAGGRCVAVPLPPAILHPVGDRRHSHTLSRSDSVLGSPLTVRRRSCRSVTSFRRLSAILQAASDRSEFWWPSGTA